MINDPKIIGLAFLSGMIPSLLWLWFWLNEDKKNPEPKGILTLVFIMGMIAVVFVLPIQKFIQANINSGDLKIILWAATEEIMKYLAVVVVLYRTNYTDEPIDWPIYFITGALGFAAVENTLFLMTPIAMGQNTVGLLTGELRFLGSTLLHTVASGILGISLGISLHNRVFKKIWHIFIGLILAVTLHSIFNFFIIRNDGVDFLKVFAFLWVVTIMVMLIFEKIRRMN